MNADDLILILLGCTLALGVLWLLFFAASDQPEAPAPAPAPAASDLPPRYDELPLRERYAFAARFIAAFHENHLGTPPHAIILLREGEGAEAYIRTLTSTQPLDAEACAGLINRTGARQDLLANISRN